MNLKNMMLKIQIRLKLGNQNLLLKKLLLKVKIQLELEKLNQWMLEPN